MKLSKRYLYSIVKSLNIKKIWIALSGGRDSLCLLDLTYKSLKQRKHNKLIQKLYAIHLNHYLNKYSENCEKFCIKSCKKLKIPLIIKRQKKYILNKELSARNFRYFWFTYFLKKNDVVFIAHNKNDKIENLILKTVKGCGINGLSSIPFKRKLGSGCLLRPFLHISRNTINNYIKQLMLNWFEDKSNFNLNFDRNYLRHHIIPKIKTRWPDYSLSLNKCIEKCKEANYLLNEFSKEVFKVIGYNSKKIYIKTLIKLSYYKLRLLINFCLNSIGNNNTSNKKITELINQIITANYSCSILVRFKTITARIWKGSLYFTNNYKNKPENIFLSWDLGCVNKINKINIKYFKIKGGEKIIRYGKIKRIKSLLQKLSIPPWERKTFIIVYYNDKPVAALNTTFSLVSDHWSAKIKIKYPFK